MPRAAVEPLVHRTVADLLEVIKPLGDIPADRIRLHPTPGTATEQDVLDVRRREGRTCELIDGILVEKVMGLGESRVALELITDLNNFLRRHNLGIAAGPDGTLRLTTGLLRIPDISFVSWDRLPGRKRPSQPVPRIPLDLAVEIISKGNTKSEMERKLREYFEAGTRLVWFLYPKNRTARVYTSPRQFTRLAEDQSLDGGDVLPGFSVSLRELFERAFRGPND
ncbi:MAG TPA: Uma2 family endonuclease [Isosphaeraceae bacterium]